MGIGNSIGKPLGLDIGSKLGSSSLIVPPILSDGNTFGWYNYENVVESGGVVSQMTDIGGLDNHLVQITGSLQPTLTADGVLFDGTDDFLKTTGGTLAQPTNIYMVVKQVTFTLFDRLIDGNGVNTMAYIQGDVSGNVRMYSGVVLQDTSVSTINIYNIHRLLYNTTSSSLQIDENTPVTGNVGTGNPGGIITLGADATGARNSNIEVKELIVRNIADTLENELAIYNYLKAKHGL